MRAIWQDTIIAESDDIVTVEGNAYFPAESLRQDLVRQSTHTSICPWKGTAHYYDLVVGDQTNPNAVWYYPEPKEAAANIRDRVAFWKGVTVSN
ncbi:DUF427 domain-containing protein [Acidisoma sp. 7E03]